MMTEVILPKLGQTMERGAIVRWLKQEGQWVERGEPLFELESDKAVLEVESPGKGYLRKVLVPVGVQVPVLTAVALLAPQADSDLGAYAGSLRETDVAQPQPRQAASPRARRRAREAGVDLASVQGSGPGGRIVERDVLAQALPQPKATPVARKLAAQAGLNLQGLEGSGPGGRIVGDDVRAALPTQGPALQPAAAAAVSGLRGIIAQRMTASHQTTAPVTLTTEADATRLAALRQELREALRPSLGFDLSYNVLLIKVAACALQAFPHMNVRWTDGGIEAQREVSIGLAVDTERGLLAPVVRRAADLGLEALAREVDRLVGQARAGHSQPDDLTGGSLTVTNLGAYEVDAFTPIINLPECAILGVGRIRQKPVVVDGEVAVRSTVWLSLTFDHRLVDGAPAARFLQRVKALVEQPCLLLA
ncbi:MAG: 2-oxo acid dehydrogenase subunit E2 [Chloroflexi bacterium]|nr:2-oxo acid dehydrogenase subunit E2 [Chloroflexota bacterium]